MAKIKQKTNSKFYRIKFNRLSSPVLLIKAYVTQAKTGYVSYEFLAIRQISKNFPLLYHMATHG